MFWLRNKKNDLSSHFPGDIMCLTKTYIVGTNKNHLIEMVLLSTHNAYFNEESEVIIQK